MEIMEKVLVTLKENGAMKAGEIAEKTGIDKKEIDKAIKALKADEKIESPKRCFYAAK
ncbi:HTH domain-containing protein [Clostridium ihumii]|uniref:HTH domain-containing protein n=1 Tax=Clostridium ihumii TaxID=1470356 RepID=UPI0005902B13|nr:HTH domain-containing protein [Clostridium ihumii]